jgi:mRNA interferase RelE/StbE
VKYTVLITRRAQKELANLPPDAFVRVLAAIRDLADNPRRHGSSKLTSREGWRLRIGDYRVLYTIEDEVHRVTVIHVGHRRDVYRS